MYANVETIDPAFASELLKKNTRNRKLGPTLSNRYADAMSRGAWLENGAPIVISRDGTLLDGQNRLMAVEKSGVSIKSVVVRDVDPKAFATIDTGLNRRLKDVLSIDGQANSAQLAAALNIHMAYKRTGYIRALYGADKPTFAELTEYASLHPEVGRSVTFVEGLGVKKTLIPRGILAGLHCLFSEKDWMLADEFVKKFVTGNGIMEDEPVGVVRARLIDDESRRQGTNRLTPHQRAAGLIQAWNYTRKGDTMQRMQVNKKGKRGVRKIEVK